MYVFASLDRLSRTELISGAYGHIKKKSWIRHCNMSIGDW